MTKTPICFVNKQNPTFENKSSDDKTSALKRRDQLVTEQKQ